jgi:hypothetical protein
VREVYLSDSFAASRASKKRDFPRRNKDFSRILFRGPYLIAVPKTIPASESGRFKDYHSHRNWLRDRPELTIGACSPILRAMLSYVQTVTTQACTFCSCCPCVSSGAGRLKI